MPLFQGDIFDQGRWTSGACIINHDIQATQKLVCLSKKIAECFGIAHVNFNALNIIVFTNGLIQ